MEMVFNVLLLVAMSFIPERYQGSPDQPGISRITHDAKLRKLLVEGKFDSFRQRVDEKVAEQLTEDLKAAGSRKRDLNPAKVLEVLNSPDHSELSGFLGLLHTAMTIGSFAVELQSLGPAKAMAAAVHWVENGLMRKTGLRPDDFPAYYQIIAAPDRPQLSDRDLEAIEVDNGHARRRMDSAYSKILTRLAEGIF